MIRALAAAALDVLATASFIAAIAEAAFGTMPDAWWALGIAAFLKLCCINTKMELP